jgi:hypothetical protein
VTAGLPSRLPAAGYRARVPFLSMAYVSAATEPMSDDDLASLLAVSRANNERDGVTGALLYSGDRFVQILEGPDAAVRSKVDAIGADPRHRNVEIMRERQIAERQFPEWTMGFRSEPDDPLRRLDGFEDILGRRGAARVQHAENEAQQFLEWLGEYWFPKR